MSEPAMFGDKRLAVFMCTIQTAGNPLRDAFSSLPFDALYGRFLWSGCVW